MTVTKVVRYTTHPDHANENERLIREVFAELAEHKPNGLRYAAGRAMRLTLCPVAGTRTPQRGQRRPRPGRAR